MAIEFVRLHTAGWIGEVGRDEETFLAEQEPIFRRRRPISPRAHRLRPGLIRRPVPPSLFGDAEEAEGQWLEHAGLAMAGEHVQVELLASSSRWLHAPAWTSSATADGEQVSISTPAGHDLDAGRRRRRRRRGSRKGSGRQPTADRRAGSLGQRDRGQTDAGDAPEAGPGRGWWKPGWRVRWVRQARELAPGPAIAVGQDMQPDFAVWPHRAPGWSTLRQTDSSEC